MRTRIRMRMESHFIVRSATDAKNLPQFASVEEAAKSWAPYVVIPGHIYQLVAIVAAGAPVVTRVGDDSPDTAPGPVFVPDPRFRGPIDKMVIAPVTDPDFEVAPAADENLAAQKAEAPAINPPLSAGGCSADGRQQHVIIHNFPDCPMLRCVTPGACAKAGGCEVVIKADADTAKIADGLRWLRWLRAKCSTCGGTGRVNAFGSSLGVKCAVCNGTGEDIPF